MQIISTRNKSVLRLATLAIVACTLFPLPAGAQPSGRSNEITVIGESTLVGLAGGDMMRYTAFNPRETESGGRNDAIRLRLTLFNPDGTTLAESPEIQIPPGQSRSISFNRADLPLAGEPGTGRAQIRTIPLWSCRNTGRYVITTSLEIVDNTGATRVFVGGVVEVFDRSTGLAAFDNSAPWSGSANYLIGTLPGQTLRFTVFNPNEPDSQGASLQRLGSRLLAIQAAGSYISQGDEVVIPPGEFRSFDFNRSSVSLQGELGTGRVQGTFTLTFNGQTSPVLPSISWELIDSATGKTEVSSSLRGAWILRNTNAP
jgi:hypothetical protein